MPGHRAQSRRQDARPEPQDPPRGGDSLAAGVSVEEGFIPDVDRLPQPGGFGEETTTTSTDFVELASYQVPAGSLALLSEVSLILDTQGEGQISVAGTTYGPFSGPLELDVPLREAVLTEGYVIRISVRSQAGQETEAKGLAVLSEV